MASRHEKLLHALYLLPMAVIAAYLISEGKPALIAFGISLFAFEIFVILYWLYGLFLKRRR